MEGGSEGENRDKDDGDMNNSGGIKAVHHNNSNEGQSKPKRQMKTPFQLETLEKAYVCKYKLWFWQCFGFQLFFFIVAVVWL